MEPVLQPSSKQQIDSIIAKPRGSVLLHGPRHVGKSTAALWVARRLNCEGCSDNSCHSCTMLSSGNHPDVILIGSDEKGKIGIEKIHELQHGLAYTQYQSGGHRVVIIEDAHTLTLPAQNSLLKTLEEPPADTLIIMTATNHTDLLPTIISRCQMIFVPTISDADLTSHLQSKGANTEQAQRIAALSRGSLGLALTYLQDSEALEKRTQMQDLSTRLLDGNLFERLVALANIDIKQADALADVLGGELQARLRNAPSATLAESLLAVKRYKERVMANVNHRAAAEALALELVC